MSQDQKTVELEEAIKALQWVTRCLNKRICSMDWLAAVEKAQDIITRYQQQMKG